MTYVYIFYLLAKILDFYSTVIQSPNAEENPLVKFLWIKFGVIGLIAINLISFIGIVFISEYGIKLLKGKYKDIIGTVIVILSIFIIIVALANLGNLTAYDITVRFLGQ